MWKYIYTWRCPVCRWEKKILHRIPLGVCHEPFAGSRPYNIIYTRRTRFIRRTWRKIIWPIASLPDHVSVVVVVIVIITDVVFSGCTLYIYILNILHTHTRRREPIEISYYYYFVLFFRPRHYWIQSIMNACYTPPLWSHEHLILLLVYRACDLPYG